MKTLLKITSVIGLLLTIVPSILIISGNMTLDQNKTLMAAGTLIWFGTVPFWMGKKKH